MSYGWAKDAEAVARDGTGSDELAAALEAAGLLQDEYPDDMARRSCYASVKESPIQLVTDDHVMKVAFEHRCDFDCWLCNGEDE